MNYAIAQVSGKQFLFIPGRWYNIAFINKGLVGARISLNKVLVIRRYEEIQLGNPFLGKSRLLAQILEVGKSAKITVLKTKPKKNYTRTRGYRELYTRILIS